jgi:HEAT repeat protein
MRRLAILEIFGEIGKPAAAATPEPLQLLNNKKEHTYIRRNAATALGFINGTVSAATTRSSSPSVK